MNVVREGTKPWSRLVDVWRITSNQEYLAECFIDWRSDQPNVREAGDLQLVLVGTCEDFLLEDSENDLASDSSSVSYPIREEERVAYGLLIHPALKHPGKFIRVGIFYSQPKGRGGMKLFEGCETRTVEII